MERGMKRMAAARVERVIDALARDLNLSKDNVVEQGVRAFLERSLHEAKAEIFRIRGQYGVSSVEDMEERYRQGTLGEKDTWRDLQRLDHLEYKKERLEKLLGELE